MTDQRIMRLVARRFLLGISVCLLLSCAASAATLAISTGANLGTASVGPLQLALTATGGTAPYTWTVAGGSTLPAGMALRTDLPSFFPTSASAGLIGVATTPNTTPYSFTLTVTDSTSTSVSQAFTLKIIALTDKEASATLPDAFVNASYSYSLAALGNAAAPAWTATSGMPAGMTLSSTGLLSGMPTAAGNYTMKFNLTDGVDTVSQNVKLNVFAINITTPGLLPNATQNAAYSTTINATGGSGSLTFTASGLPSGLAMNPSGTISGTVTAGPGRSSVSVTATDTSSVSYTKNMSLDVVGVPPTLPRISPYGYQEFDGCTLDSYCSRGVGVVSGGTAPFTWNATGLPAGMLIRSGDGVTSSSVTPGDVEIWGMAAATTTTTSNVQLTVTDATGATATETFPITVSALQQTDFLTSGTVGAAYSTKLRVIGGTAPYTVAQTGGLLPAGLTFNPTTFVVSGTPTEGGRFRPVFVFTDSAGNSLQQTNNFSIGGGTSTVTINTGNGDFAAFVNEPNLGTVTVGSSYSNQLSASGATSFVWTQIGGTLPPGLTLSPGGLLSGTVTAAGTYVFVVQAADSSSSTNVGVRQLTLIVTPISVTTGGTLPFGNVNTAYSQTLAATGATGAVGWALAPFNNHLLPPGLTLASTGAITGTPTATGQYRFTVIATDTASNIFEKTFTISIYPTGAFPPVAITSSGSFGTQSIGTDQFCLSATGGNGTYAWSVISGSLPTGMALRTDPASSCSSSASAGIDGLATSPGPYNFTLQVTSAGLTATQNASMKITALVVKEVWSTLPDAFVNAPYSYTLTALNNAGPVTWTSTTGMPAGMTLSPTGVLSGTPTTAGTYTINFALTDGTDTIGRWVALNVRTINITTNGLLPNATQGQAYSTTVTASGGTGIFTFTPTSICSSCNGAQDNLPAGLAINTSGTISGTVTGGPGLYTFRVTATDSSSVSYTKYMSIDVIGVPPELPRIIPYGNFDDCTLGRFCSRGFFVQNGGTAPFNWTATGLPPGMSIRFGDGITTSGIRAGNGELWGSPTATGTYNVQVTVTDANGTTATETFPLHISPLLQWGPDSLPNGTLGVAYSPKLRLLGGSNTYNGVSQIGGLLPAGLTLNAVAGAPPAAPGNVSGTPTEDGIFCPVLLFSDNTGVNTLKMTNCFTIGGGTSTITIFSGGNFYGPPPNLGTVTVGSSYSNQLSARGAASFTWTQTGGTLPPGLTLSSGGLLSGTVTTVGTYIFMVQAADASNPTNVGLRQLTLIVTPLALTTGSLPYGNVNSPYNQTLVVTGASGFVTWALASTINGNLLPPGLTISSGGTISGTPTAAGQFFFQVTATDSANPSLPLLRGFTINIFPAGTVPPLFLSVGNIAVGSGSSIALGRNSLQLIGSGGVPPYTYSYTPSATTVPGMRVQNGPPLPTNFPSTATGGFFGIANTAGTYNTSIRVTDSATPTPNTFDRAITFTVLPLNTTSQNPLPHAVLNLPYTFTFGATGGTGPYLFSLTSTSSPLPAGLTLGSTGVLSGTPTAAGTFSFTLRLTDSASNSINVGYTLTVDPFAIGTSGILPSGTVGVPYTVTLSAVGGTGPYTWAVTSTGSSILTDGLTLNASTGVISGTPTSVRIRVFTVQATDSTGKTTSRGFELQVVSATPQPLVVSSTSPDVFVPDDIVGDLYNVTSFAAGGVPPYTWSLAPSSTLPPGFILTNGCDSIMALGSPGVLCLSGRGLVPGTYPFTLNLTDSASNTTSQVFSLRVATVSVEYTSLPLSGTSLTLGAAYSQTMLGFGGSAATNSYTWTLGSLPAGTTTVSGNPAKLPTGLSINSAGVISGTPQDTGRFTFPIQLTDSLGATGQRNVTFNVGSGTTAALSINNGPDLGTTPTGGTFSQTLSPSGSPLTTPNYVFTLATGSSLPPGFQLLAGNAVLSGVAPDSTVLFGVPSATGTFTFTLQVQDASGNIGARTMTLRVAADTFFTSGTTGLPDGSVGVAYSAPLVAFGAAQTFGINFGSALPLGLSLNTTTGAITGTPATAGDFTFSVTVTDAASLVISRTFSLHISSIAITDPSVLPNATTNAMLTYNFNATGGGTSKTWSVASGSLLPVGLSLSTSGALTGTPTSSGRTTFVITVTDGTLQVSKRFSLFVVNPIPGVLTSTLAGALLADATVGQSYSTTLNMNGGTPPYTWTVFSGSTLPPGLALYLAATLGANQAPGTILLAGAPTTAGQYTFTLDLADSSLPVAHIQRTFTLNVSPVNIPSNALNNPTYNTPYTQTVTAFGGTAPYTFTLVTGPIAGAVNNLAALPTGLSFSSGTISGTPTDTGNFTFSIQAKDANGKTFTRSFTLVVNTTNPKTLNITNTGSLASLSVGVGSVGGPFIATYTDGTPVGPLTWTATGLPPGMSFVTGVNTPLGFDPTQWYLTGQPTTPGAFVATWKVTDAAGNFGLRTTTINVSPLQPLGSNLLPAAVSGSAYSFNMALTLAGGTPPYSFALTSGSLLPTGLSLSSAGVLSGTTTLTGNFGFSVTVTDHAGATFTSGNATLVVLGPTQNWPLSMPGSLTRQDGRGNYLRLLNNFINSGGVPPFTWTLAPSSTLPPGLSITSADPTFGQSLLGNVTVPGTYTFTLNVTDSVGQTGSVPVTGNISPISVGTLPTPATVGTPYSVTLAPSGGAAPYTFQLAGNGSLPPGVTVSTTGVVSGTPLGAGVFRGPIAITDSNTNVLSMGYHINSGSSSNPAALLSITSAVPIRATFTQGGSAPAAIPIAVADAGTPLTVSAAVNGIPGASLTATSGSTAGGPFTTNLTFSATALSGLAVGNYYGVFWVSSPQTPTIGPEGALIILTVVAAPPPCSFTASPTGSSFGTTGGTGTIVITAGLSCTASNTWTASDADSWVTITAPASGTGNGSVSFTVAANGTTSPRTSTITVGGQSYTITQFGSTCSFAITPSSLSAGAAGGTASIGITSSISSCPWTASAASAPFVTITSGINGTGNGTTNITIAANGSAAPQSGTLTIAGQTFTVNQAGTACTMSLGSASASLTSSGGSGSVSLTIANGCTYSTLTGPNWVTVTSGGSGTSTGAPITLDFQVAANSSTQARSGFLVIGGQTFEVDQDGVACSFTVTPVNNPIFPSSGGTGSIAVNSNGSGCNWTASSSSDPPVHITSGASGTGPGTVNFTVAANATTSPISASLTVAGQTVPVSQAGTVCNYSLRSTSGSVPAIGAAGSVGVLAAAPCAWTATASPTNPSSFLTIVSSGNQGTSDINYSAAANTSASPRTGTITVSGGNTFTVTQAGATCTYTLASTSANLGSSGTPGSSVNFSTTATGCSPTVASFSNWITVISSPFAGKSGTVNYSVAANSVSTTRTGLIQVGDQTFSITQSAAACAFSLNAYGAAFSQIGGAGNILASPSGLGCGAPVDGVSDPTAVTLGTLVPPAAPDTRFTQPYTVQPYQALVNFIRILQVNISGTIFTVKQSSW